MKKQRPRLTATQLIAFGFALIILIGALLLTLPAANKSGQSIPFLNALFSATSATCVTGLVVYDTWTQFTGLGQAVLLILIQIGGLGFMTVAVLFSLVLKKRIGLRERALISESISFMQIGGIVRLARRILIGTALFEGVGAVLLAIRFCPTLGPGEGIWYAVFHSVSAFCNAGFDLMGRYGQYSSLTSFSGDVLVNCVIMFLIASGGIGFIVWNDVFENGLRFKKYGLHTKIMLTASAALILLGAVIFFAAEGNASMAGMPLGERILASFFQSVTPRTAGFNTVDLTKLSDAGVTATILLMFIGAGTGSTGGGLKVTTVAVALLSLVAYARGREDVNVFHRRIDPSLERRAFCTGLFYVLMLFAGVMLISFSQALPLKDLLLEVFSALGTVGLSTGVTRELNVFSRVVIMLMMYFGRVGSLTVVLSVSERQTKVNLTNPVEKIVIS